MKLTKREKFISQMIVLFMLMLGVSIAIRANYYSQLVLWGLFAYIIAKEFIDWYRCEKRRKACEEDKEKIAQVMAKLDKLKKDIQGTV